MTTVLGRPCLRYESQRCRAASLYPRFQDPPTDLVSWSLLLAMTGSDTSRSQQRNKQTVAVRNSFRFSDEAPTSMGMDITGCQD